MATKHVIIAGDDGTLYRVHVEQGRVEKLKEDDPDYQAAHDVVRQGKPQGFIGEADASGKKQVGWILNQAILTQSILTHVVNLGAKSSDD